MVLILFCINYYDINPIKYIIITKYYISYKNSNMSQKNLRFIYYFLIALLSRIVLIAKYNYNTDDKTNALREKNSCPQLKDNVYK